MLPTPGAPPALPVLPVLPAPAVLRALGALVVLTALPALGVLADVLCATYMAPLDYDLLCVCVYDLLSDAVPGCDGGRVIAPTAADWTPARGCAN